MARFLSSRRLASSLVALLLAAGMAPARVSAQGIKLSPAQRARAHGELPLTSFYDTPVPLPPGNPGELIRNQPFDDYNLPDGVSAIRILYRSVSAMGADVASSGVVLVPRGSAPKGGWPIIAWAHPFTAVARQCAPSLKRDLGSGSALSMFVNLGYAVVATDYVGLGTAFRNAGYDMRSNAADVIYAVQAARQAVPQLGRRWIVVGQRDGGAAALSVSEMQSGDSGLLGSISIAGDLDLRDATGQTESGTWQDRLAYLAYSIKTVFTEFRPEEMLAAKGMARYTAVTPQCTPPALKTPLSTPETLKPEWLDLKLVQSFFARNTLGLKAARVPLLIISPSDPRNSVDAQVVARMCSQKDRIDFKTYPGIDANELIGTTVATQMAWIKARFEGRMTQNTCH